MTAPEATTPDIQTHHAGGPRAHNPERNEISGTHMQAEILSQPQMWREAAAVAAAKADVLLQPGQRVAAVGCGTSAFISQTCALLREGEGGGYTDWFVASEWPGTRDYDVVLAITRSGTTTEVLDLLKELRGKVRTVAIVGDPDSPAVELADAAILLPFADETDETSVVQTRFATSTLSLLRASIGQDIEALAAAAEKAVFWEVPQDVVARDQFTFLAEAFVAAAEAAGRPVVLQISENAAKYHGPLPQSGSQRSRSREHPPQTWWSTWTTPQTARS